MFLWGFLSTLSKSIGPGHEAGDVEAVYVAVLQGSWTTTRGTHLSICLEGGIEGASSRFTVFYVSQLQRLVKVGVSINTPCYNGSTALLHLLPSVLGPHHPIPVETIVSSWFVLYASQPYFGS